MISFRAKHFLENENITLENFLEFQFQLRSKLFPSTNLLLNTPPPPQ